jgi:hypothetical protein
VRARRLGALAAGLVGGAVIVACCALGPASVAAGLASALAGVSLGRWLAAVGGLTLVVAVVVPIWRRRQTALCRLQT